MNTAGTILATHLFVGSVAWTYGYAVGRLMEHRAHDVADLREHRLFEPPPYDWARDGEAIEAIGARP